MPILPTFSSFRKQSYPPDHDYWYYPVGATTESGVRISEESALKYLTVMACVSLIAGDVAKLPLNLYRKRSDGGKDTVTDHVLYDLLHNAPNPETTSFNWRETLQSHALLWGNLYAFIERDKTNKIKALWQLPDPGAIKVERTKQGLIYKYKNADGDEVTRTRNEIFHIPGYGFNGLIGLSNIQVARETIGLGLAAEKFGSSYFGKGTHPAGIYEMDGMLGDNKAEFLQNLREGVAGLGNAHSIMVAEGGAKYKPLTVPLNDAQFLETRQFQKTEICGMYHVPPHKVAIHGDNSNYNNLEQENASYVDSCLMAWLKRWETNISLQLLTEAERRQGLFFEFVVQGLLRGDSQARSEYYNKMFQIGGMSANDIRSKENLNPVSGGDQNFVMMNMVPLDQAGELFTMPNNEPEPEKEENSKDVLKDFFSEKRATRASEAKSIQIRDRIQKQYAPLIFDAAQNIVNRESKAIKTKTTQLSRAGQSMESFLDEFYKEFPEYINRKMGPVLRSYIEAIINSTSQMIDIDSPDLDNDIKDYIDSYAKRHVSSSKGQMSALIEHGFDEMDTRADEWQERRPEKIKDDEGVRASNFAFQAVAFGAGYSTVLRNRGSSTCPFCKSLANKSVRKGGKPLVRDGEELQGKGTDQPPMLIRGNKYHPPIHQKCDCYLSII